MVTPSVPSLICPQQISTQLTDTVQESTVAWNCSKAGSSPSLSGPAKEQGPGLDESWDEPVQPGERKLACKLWSSGTNSKDIVRSLTGPKLLHLPGPLISVFLVIMITSSLQVLSGENCRNYSMVSKPDASNQTSSSLKPSLISIPSVFWPLDSILPMGTLPRSEAIKYYTPLSSTKG